MSQAPKKPRVSGEHKLVPVDSLEPNAWNPNVQSEFKYQKELESIKEFGFMDPITVRSGRDKGALFPKKQIVDGFHRWKAAKELGLTEVPIYDLGRVSDERAKVLTDIMNNLRGENDPLKWQAMVQSVIDNAPDLVDLLPYKRDEIDALLSSAKVDWDGLDEMNAEPHDKAQVDDKGKLFKKFSVSVPEATMAQAADLIRKIKAAYKLENDAAAFKVLLDSAASTLAGKRQSVPPTAPQDVKSAPPRRKRSVTAA